MLAGTMGLSEEAAAASTHVLGAKKAALDPANDTVNEGYYPQAALSDVDTDLVEANIINGVTIFGKLGAYTTSYALPDTGQAGDYVARFGEDSDYQVSGTQPSYAIYSPVGVSSVTVDNLTGLMWVTNPVDAAISASYTWENAITACESLSYAGYEDWRLPNITELISIVDYGAAAAPRINGAYFMNTQAVYYWSSTTNGAYTPNAWNISFNDGNMGGGGGEGDKAALNYIRCVRGSPWEPPQA